MKNTLFSIVLYVVALNGFAQNGVVENPEQIIYKDETVDQPPDFPGGIDNFYKYFARHFTKPAVNSLVDKVVLSFVVEIDGSLSDIRIVHDAGFGTANQCLTILQTGPSWVPGNKDGKAVRVFHLLPISIITAN